MPQPPNPHAWKLADLESVPKNGFRVMSTFACGGGSSLGYKRAGFEVVAANDIDPVMAEHYKKNLNPKHYFLCPIGDMTAKNPDGSYKMELPEELYQIDVLDGSPPCFPAGTPITTRDGRKPIQDVRVGDVVLTHRGEWRPVTELFKHDFHGKLVTLRTKYGREPVTATPNHPFFVRRRLRNRMGRKAFSSPEWVEAGSVRSGDLLLEPRYYGYVELPTLTVRTRTSRGKVLHERTADIDVESCDVAWLLGLYIAEGHRRGVDPASQETAAPSRREIILSVHREEVPEVSDRVTKAGFHPMISAQSENCSRVSISSPDLWAYCAEFGDGAQHKRLPPWVWRMPVPWLRELLSGYWYGDGHVRQNGRTKGQIYRASTVSYELARGLLELVRVVTGCVASIKKVSDDRWGEIEGRLVRCHETWVVGYVPVADHDVRERPCLVDDHGSWVPVRDVTESADIVTCVYNFGVAQHHTYVAAGFAVHNCSTFSPSGSREKAWGKTKKFREGQADQVLSDLFFDYLDLVDRLRPVVAIAENVQGMLLGNAKGYVRMVMARFRSAGYRPQLFQVNAADCGVAQSRRRVFFLAVRDDIAQAANLGPVALTFQHRHVSTMEACSDVQALTIEEIEETKPLPADLKWWAVTRPGEKYAAALARAGAPNSMWNWIRHPAHRPACTLVSNHQCMKHWTVCRALSFREYKRLGSFPDDYWAKDPQTGKYLIGMSVPPKMTEAVAREVLRCWLTPAKKAIQQARTGT